METIYTSADAELVRSLLEEYDVEYIFVGSCEREKYPNLNEELLQSLGEVVFSGEKRRGIGSGLYHTGGIGAVCRTYSIEI